MATIRDVAQKADVHPSTVSRVFSGSGTISDVTRERVLKAAKSLGFQPNAIARSLSIQRTNTIGIVVPYIYEGFFDDNFFPQIMRGMLEASYKHGFRLIVGGSQAHEDEISQIMNIMGSSQADGIVVMSSRLDVDTVGALKEMETPFVLIGHPPSRSSRDIPWVDCNNHKATRHAIEYLLKLGHRRIAYVGGDPEILTTQERLVAYKETLTEAGIDPRPEWIDYGYFAEEGGYTAIERIHRNSQPPTAYYAANDLMAMGIMQGLSELDIRVPDDVSVIGTNDAPIAAHSTPSLTTIKVPYAHIAGKAVEMLIEQIVEGSMSEVNHLVDCSLVVRASTQERQS